MSKGIASPNHAIQRTPDGAANQKTLGRMNNFTVQRAVCERFGASFLAFDQTEKVGIALHTLTQLPLNALRLTPENGTCGWYVWGGEYSSAPDFFVPLHAAHLSERCESIVSYLGLAPGWRVQIAPNHEDVWFDGELLKWATIRPTLQSTGLPPRCAFRQPVTCHVGLLR